MPYEDDYKMWLEKMLIKMNPDWICEGMHDTEFTHDWCYKYCGKDDLYITPKCLHMFYHHIARADRKTEPIIEVYNGNADKENWQCITIKPIEDEPQTQKPCDNCQEFDCYGCEYKQMKGSE